MTVRLVLQLERGSPDLDRQLVVTGDRFTIGRGADNDWVLPDPERNLSRQHCLIERRGDSYFVVDTSANGVFVNYEPTPLGRGHERGLRHGDRLQLGSYVIAVMLEGASEPAPTEERGKLWDPTHLPGPAPKERAGRVSDGTWIGGGEVPGVADRRAMPSGRPAPRCQTAPEHRPVDLGKRASPPAWDPFDLEPPSERSDERDALDRDAAASASEDANSSLFDRDSDLGGPSNAPTGLDTLDPCAAPPQQPAAPPVAPPLPADGDRIPSRASETDPGRIAFNPPERMKVGRVERIEVRLSRDVAAKLTEGLRGRGAPRIEPVEIVDRMRVRLLGDDFTIAPRSSEDQLVRHVGFAQWDFDVRPERGGRRFLRLLVTLRLRCQETQELCDLPALEREIAVQVAPVYAMMTFTRRNWKWLAASIVLPLIAWLATGAGLTEPLKSYVNSILGVFLRS